MTGNFIRAFERVAKAESNFMNSKTAFEMAKYKFGESLKRERTTKKLSLRDCAKKIGISAPYLFDIENGKRFPSDTILQKIVNTLT